MDSLKSGEAGSGDEPRRTGCNEPDQSGCGEFVQRVTSSVNAQDTAGMISAQLDMLARFERTNEMLATFNTVAQGRFANTLDQFEKNTRILLNMRRDLDNIFRKIRSLKSALSAKYPDAFKVVTENLQRQRPSIIDSSVGSMDELLEDAAVTEDGSASCSSTEENQDQSRDENENENENDAFEKEPVDVVAASSTDPPGDEQAIVDNND